MKIASSDLNPMHHAEGQITFSAYRRTEGGRISNLQRKEIRLDLITPEDEGILAEKGLTALRQTRILRLLTRAAEQDAVLTYDHLVQLLCTSLSTVRRDVRTLHRMGFAVPVHRRRGRRAGVLFFPVLIVVLWSSKAYAQLSSLFGTIGFDYEYQTQNSESASTTRQLFMQKYNLGAEGRILDPRLATFFLSGGFDSSFLGEENAKASAFSGSMSILPGGPLGLTLRGGTSFSAGRTETEGSSLGANLRITRPDWPQLFVDFDRITIASHGDSRLDSATTTGKIRLSHRFWSTLFDGELGVQHLADQIKDSAQDRYFARLNNVVNWSPTTTLRSINDAFLQGNQLVIGSSYSIDNRPDPTLSRSAGLVFRSNKSGEDQEYSLGLTGAITKSFSPFPWLQSNAFTSAVTQKNFGPEGSAGVAWSGGSSAIVSYFRPIALLTDYALALSYQTDIGKLGTTQQAHLGAISRTLEPLRLAGDYYLGFQTGATQSTRQFIVGRADTAISQQLSLRSVLDFLIESSRSSDSPESSNDHKVANIALGASYRPLFNLTFDASGNAQWNDSREMSGVSLGGNVHISYVVPSPGTPTVDITGRWQQATANEEKFFDIRSRLSYRLGQVILSLEHSFERRDTAGSAASSNSIRFSVTRPFRFSFN